MVKSAKKLKFVIILDALIILLVFMPSGIKKQEKQFPSSTNCIVPAVLDKTGMKKVIIDTDKEFFEKFNIIINTKYGKIEIQRFKN